MIKPSHSLLLDKLIDGISLVFCNRMRFPDLESLLWLFSDPVLICQCTFNMQTPQQSRTQYSGIGLIHVGSVNGIIKFTCLKPYADYFYR